MTILNKFSGELFLRTFQEIFIEILVIADWSNNKVARKITLEPEMKPKDEI